MNLTQQTILLTGGGSGIGLALAERLHAVGNTVLICGRDAAKLQAAAERLPGLRTLVCDVAQTAERQRLFEWATTECPDVNVLLNNAGVQRTVSVLENTEAWATTAGEIAINLEAPMHLALLFVGYWHTRQQAAPVIINVSSGLGFVPLARVPVYSATKAALHSFTQSLRRQLAGTPTQVIEIIPPAVHTELGGTDHSFGVPLAEYADDVMQQLAAGHLEIAYGFSAKASQATRPELDSMFQQLNG
ncbi:SDR family NAD(P)-dependent oxidoreductase [Hymenobacter sp. UV11]|uniref:SDR family oxidoreductase n=1 Tax=Hymenobacter sp. UV11 TaxID=1849735 RepID=UPI001061B0E6|nr:SDR family NAD(P)-dependent oxidoreductase [Hymenobacter sp. UV11]TDN37619.1 short-chain dehydrogenase [Hymenobacter sp. UV11]TFZ68815.1 SDR family NAD(P)-dependent oxidoreductase [Hymenobacter sp. UV11]